MEYSKSPVVFVVDRNPIHGSLIKYHLNVNRFLKVHVFQSEEECIYRLGKNLFPDFLITDHNVDGNNGFDILEKVKKMSPDVRIIFFSSCEDPILAFRLLEAGASDYIVKTSQLAIGIAELIKNVKYLCRDEIQVKKIY